MKDIKHIIDSSSVAQNWMLNKDRELNKSTYMIYINKLSELLREHNKDDKVNGCILSVVKYSDGLLCPYVYKTICKIGASIVRSEKVDKIFYIGLLLEMSSDSLHTFCKTLSHKPKRFESPPSPVTSYKPSANNFRSKVACLKEVVSKEYNLDDEIILKLTNIMDIGSGGQYEEIEEPNLSNATNLQTITVYCTTKPCANFIRSGFKKIVCNYVEDNNNKNKFSILIKGRQVILVNDFPTAYSGSPNTPSSPSNRAYNLPLYSADKMLKGLALVVYVIKINHIINFQPDNRPCKQKTVRVVDKLFIGAGKKVLGFVQMDLRNPLITNKIFPGYCWELFLDIKLFLDLRCSTFPIIAFGKIAILCEDLCRIFKLNRWLTDRVIYVYFMEITMRSNNTIRIFDSFFLNSVTRDYQRIFRTHVKSESVFKYEKLLFIGHNDKHWVLYVVDIIKKTLTIYDSMSSIRNDLPIIFGIFQYLTMESLLSPDYKMDYNEWSIIEGVCPKQTNSDDCGVYVCANAEFISRNLPLDYTPMDIPLLRQRIVYELIIGRLLSYV